ncbi:FabD/lysophospholipase-like protein [Teratosphaeria nubilosa]|uniref:FabD/lysophospholipase-like protein n=1 Tax=Teratosphaeria nubilosa TaxID=161662 RepID=A0A6G1LAC0_9PEZI|nr:FabD/lysophospholipase-like protein [Teratosphaeria nubilosa]
MGAGVSSATTDTSGVHRSRAPSVRRRAETQDSDKAGRSWARHVDDAWWPCILTLDGGGIRGYSSLLILQALMHEVWIWEQKLEQEDSDGANGTAPTIADLLSEEELLPCHYFDFMYGTSTGGLIATILGRLRMTVSEGLELYRKVGDDLFGKRRSNVPLMTKYHHEPLEKAVQDIVGARCHDHQDCDGKDDLHPWDTDHFDEILGLQVPFDVDRPRVCQSCCLTATHDQNISEAYLLRSYPHYYTETAPNWITRYNEGADELPIWKVTRATTAAPFYFELVEHEVEGVRKSFKDGGIRENNPSGAALSEFHSLYDGKAETPAIMLSVGTGLPDQSQDGFASAGAFGRLPFVSKFLEKRAVVQNLLIKYTEGEKQHHSMRDYAHGENTWYKRLNVSHGLQNMALDDWRRGEWHGEQVKAGGASLTHMEEVTEMYLDRGYDPAVDSYAPPRTMLVQAAEKLVRQRRARERLGGERWDTFIGSPLHRKKDYANGDVS